MSDAKATIKDAKCVGASDKALKVRIPDPKGTTTRHVWVPKSAIHDDSEVYDDRGHSFGKLVVKPWFAEQIGVELD